MSGKSEKRTLLASVVMSAPGPFIVGAGLLLGQSSTQIADFIRRTAEFAAIFISFMVFHAVSRSCAEDKETQAARKAKLEHAANTCVGVAMGLSGAVMLVIGLFYHSSEKGNVIPGLVIALLGVIANTLFWIRYRGLNRKNPNLILAAQSNLYRAKALVDFCVTAALVAIVLFPDSDAALYMDAAGTVAVAVYLLITGVMTVVGKAAKSR